MKGAKESKEFEGKLGGFATMIIQGKAGAATAAADKAAPKEQDDA